MTTLEHSIYIDAPSDVIDGLALDPWRLPEWYAGVESVEPDDLFPDPGGHVTMVYKAAGATLNIKMTSLELVRGEYVLYHLEGMMEGTTRWTDTPEGNGTRVSAVFAYELPGGGLGKVADKLVVERMNAKNLEESLHNLKTLVEAM